jgi:hypothetical protein
MKCRTVGECLEVDPETWSEHVRAFRTDALEKMRIAVDADRTDTSTHWRLFAEVLQLDPRDSDGYGLLDRWDGDYEGNSGDCSSGCVHYRPLAGTLGADWGVCTNPASHRAGKLTFEHQGCPAFEAPKT